jgi:hypothetical protein
MRLLAKLDHTVMTVRMNDHDMITAREYRIEVTRKVAGMFRVAWKFAMATKMLNESLEIRKAPISLVLSTWLWSSTNLHMFGENARVTSCSGICEAED